METAHTSQPLLLRFHPFTPIPTTLCAMPPIRHVYNILGPHLPYRPCMLALHGNDHAFHVYIVVNQNNTISSSESIAGYIHHVCHNHNSFQDHLIPVPSTIGTFTYLPTHMVMISHPLSSQLNPSNPSDCSTTQLSEVPQTIPSD